MRKKIYSFIVVLYTIFTICIFKFYATNEKREEITLNIFDRQNIMINQENSFNIQEKNSVEKEEVNEEKTHKDTQNDINRHNFNNKKFHQNIYLEEEYSGNDIIVEEKFDSYNIQQKEKNSVMKIPPEEIETALSINDKVKLFAISDKIPKEEQDKISDYLQYKNQKIGVRKSLDVLKNYLSEKELYEVKKIARKFIDMDTVENDN